MNTSLYLSQSYKDAWADYHDTVVVEPKKLERYEFHERAKKAYAVIQTGEDRQYGNLILVKGVVV